MGKSRSSSLVVVFLCLCAAVARPRCGDIPRIVTPRGRVRPRLPLGPLYVVVAAGTGGEASGRRFAGPTGAPGDLHKTATTLDRSEPLVFAASNGAYVPKRKKRWRASS